ncbi:hypothetical protein C2S51_026986 [Perilla frutescens var. frutescens]|nr:hypothetical protein C2S51_026986 [Perilla frutescens var. frutescens]
MFILATKLMMVADSFYIPKIIPEKPLGEDAHFFCRTAQVIGVADGVGGWARKGIDAGEYARELMRNAADSVKFSCPSAVDPKSVLFYAFKKTAKPGSSTACIINLDGNRLRAANLGDSGFSVIREGTTIYRSPVQQHEFNMPYQLGIGSSPDGPVEAAEMVVEVESGDIIVVGTDGLFDNVFPEDVEATVNRCLKDGTPLAMVARELAKTALHNSLKRDTVSPYEVAAYEAGVAHSGGKPDDITVVVAYVLPMGITFG